MRPLRAARKGYRARLSGAPVTVARCGCAGCLHDMRWCLMSGLTAHLHSAIAPAIHPTCAVAQRACARPQRVSVRCAARLRLMSSLTVLPRDVPTRLRPLRNALAPTEHPASVRCTACLRPLNSLTRSYACHSPNPRPPHERPGRSVPRLSRPSQQNLLAISAKWPIIDTTQ